MPNPTPIAVAISDIHLSLSRPACRADKDWMEVQAHYLKQVVDAAKHSIPILIAGDIFDRWNPPPELINFALKYLPTGALCVPGQHDLPNHRIEGMHRSGYGVLKQAGKIIDISNPKLRANENSFIVRGFGWNQEVEGPHYESLKQPCTLHIALIHRYCWIEGKSYPGATEDSKATAYQKQLKGYDVAFYGDNHKRFLTEVGNCKVVNCGGFIRRKSDEIMRKPAMALLYSDGSVSWKPLDTSIDVFNEQVEDRPEVPLDMVQFIKGLESLGEEGLDFRAACENHLRSDDIEDGVKQIILKALEHNANS